MCDSINKGTLRKVKNVFICSPIQPSFAQILVKGATLGLARDLNLEWLPGAQGDVPS